MKTFNQFVTMLTQKPSTLYTGNHKDGALIKAEILEVLEDCKIIIDNSQWDQRFSEVGVKSADSISPPFKTNWIQPPDDTVMEIIVNEVIEQIHGVFLHEREPFCYSFAIVLTDRDSKIPALRVKYGIIFSNRGEPENTFEWKALFAALTPFGKSNHIGTVKVHEHIKFKNLSGEKKFFKIKKIVHVFSGTKKAKEMAREKYLNIDWSHQWAVRGHWRGIKGIGKNRGGEYGQKGFTWVEDHVKGPEDKPLIQKTRIIREVNNE